MTKQLVINTRWRIRYTYRTDQSSILAMARFREFDTDEALDKIKNVFWSHGYEGASLVLIEEATGLKKQSLYRAFGDKRSMYLAALIHYEQKEIAEVSNILSGAGSALDRIDCLFKTVIDGALKSGDRRGCFLCNASVDQAPLDPETDELVQKMMSRFEQAILACLMDSGYEYGVRTHAMVAMISMGYFGIRVMIKAGRPGKTLHAARRKLLECLKNGKNGGQFT